MKMLKAGVYILFVQQISGLKTGRLEEIAKTIQPEFT